MDKLIYQKLANINRAVGAIGKNSRNQQQNFNFRGIDEVMNELHAIFAKEGVIIIPEVVDFQVTPETTARGGKLFYTRARINHHFVAEDGSEVSTTTVGEAMDSGDKGMNKALSIALKYALLQMFLIPTKEEKDPDTRSYEVVSTQAPAQPTVEDFVAQLRAANNRDQIGQIWRTASNIYPAEVQQGGRIFQAGFERATQLDTRTA